MVDPTEVFVKPKHALASQKLQLDQLIDSRPPVSLVDDEELRNLMVDCWDADPEVRPHFGDVSVNGCSCLRIQILPRLKKKRETTPNK